MFNIKRKEIKFGDEIITIETGKIARQATGSVTARMGNTVVLAAVVGKKEAKQDVDFFPLTVNYIEKYYAKGAFPGGFFKRESRPSERETLISRLIDRPIRPLFPEGFFNEVQVSLTLVSYDEKHQPDVVAMMAASAALAISGIPFDGPIGAARVGFVNGEFTLNPSAEALKDSALDLVVAGTKDAVLMVESEAKELDEQTMLDAVMFGHNAYANVIDEISAFAKEAGKEAWEVTLFDNSENIAEVEKLVGKDVAKAYTIVEKQKRVEALSAAKDKLVTKLIEEKELSEKDVMNAFKSVQSKVVRTLALDDQKRIDGRSPEDIRNIVTEVDLLPSTHGSALFTRGETQALAVTTLGVADDMQTVDDIEGVRSLSFMLHYNFPAYSVGECGMLRAPGRREIGHGKLAARALDAMIPSKEEFPYTIRVVSEITESNGSSSMATVCGASMSMMSAGVPMKSPVAGIAMGLIKEDDKFTVLSDIMGDEDHLGDMDFKVAGTEGGITALQMDIKIKGITQDIMDKALTQAKAGRMHILGEMAKTLDASRSELAGNAPQIKTIQINKEKIGALIGPGGKMIKEITETTNAKIEIQDDGTVNVAASNEADLSAALAMVNDIVSEPEVGKTYNGKVVRIVDFGAFVAISKTKEGLVHVSEMAEERVEKPSDVVSEGQEIQVKLIDIDRSGRIKLSMKALLPGASENEDESNKKKRPSKKEAVNEGGAEESATSKERPVKKHKEDRVPKKSRDDKGPRNTRRNDDDSSSNNVSSSKKRRFF